MRSREYDVAVVGLGGLGSAAAYWLARGGHSVIAFEQFAAYCALAAAVAGFGYSTAFSIYLNDSSRGSAYASSLLLLTGALLSTAVFTGLYGRLRETDASFALWAFVLALADKGTKRALVEDPHLADGLNVHDGMITHPAVAEALGETYVPPRKALGV